MNLVIDSYVESEKEFIIVPHTTFPNIFLL